MAKLELPVVRKSCVKRDVVVALIDDYMCSILTDVKKNQEVAINRMQ
jgi:hypothetical protein